MAGRSGVGAAREEREYENSHGGDFRPTGHPTPVFSGLDPQNVWVIGLGPSTWHTTMLGNIVTRGITPRAAASLERSIIKHLGL
jgi:hypothetical protein